MDFFTRLDRETIEDLREDFVVAESGNNEGIDIYTFVRTLLKYWPCDNLEEFIGRCDLGICTCTVRQVAIQPRDLRAPSLLH